MKLVKTIILLFIIICPTIYLSAQTFTHVDDPNNPINSANLRGFYRGCAWVDIDNDGDLDLSMTDWAFRNEGLDSFSIIQSFGNGPAGIAPHFLGGVSWADYDNDGDLDCLYSHTFFSLGANEGNTFIYENDGTGTFTKKLIATENLRTWSAAFGEYNNDGFVDVTCAVAFQFSGLTTPAFFYTGNADGSFTKQDTFEFTQNTAPYTVAYWTDIDQDGDSDLMIASGPGGSPGPDYHYRNMLKETGTQGLERMTNEGFATDPQDGQCYNLIDHDLDGDLDLYLTNYGGATNRFYENQNGTFTSVTNNLVFDGPMLGNCWGDFDNDGDQDVLLTADNLSLAGYFENQSGTFEKVSNPFETIFSGGNVSGLSIGDYDGDGDLDFFANGGASGNSGPRALFKNDLGNSNHWIQFDLEGSLPSNRAAIGAQVWIKAMIDGQDRWLHREVSAQNTFMGHNALRVHFGIGTATTVDSIRVLWPSGTEEIHTGITSDILYQLTEGGVINSNHNLNDFDTHGSIQILPNPASNDCFLEIPNQEYFQSGIITITNLSGQIVYASKVSQSKTKIDLSDFISGVYNVTWEINTRNYMGRFIVNK